MLTRTINGKPYVGVSYAYPETLVQVTTEDGKTVWVREPGHATRLARDTDASIWYESAMDRLVADGQEIDDYTVTRAYA
jgi:hypothetical protein